MSEVKRLPDADGWWWERGSECPLQVDVRNEKPFYYNTHFRFWELCHPGQYLPCPAPKWPPEPPPRPKMVWASSDAGPPQWWVRDEDGDWIALGRDSQWRQDGMQLTPHDHPEQSAEESRRILEAEKNS